SNDAQGFAPYFETLVRNFFPAARVHFAVSAAQLAREHDDFGQHHLSNAARVTKGRVKNGNAALLGRGEINLVGPDAKRAVRQQPARFLDHFGGDLGLAPNPEDMDVADLSPELIGLERARKALDLKPLAAKDFVRAGMNIFEQEDFDLFFGEARLGHAGVLT